MSASNSLESRRRLERTVGPSPWYWKTFPSVIGNSGRELVWTHHGDQGSMAYVVSLSAPERTERPVLALNTYCRPFLVPPSYLGVWCPEGRNIRLACFDPAQLKEFDIAEIAGWFKQSSDRIYSASPPVADFEVAPLLGAGTHKIEVPEQFRSVDELIIPAGYPAKSSDEPAFALYVFYLRAGLVEVLPQRWFTADQYDIGYQWITRAMRDSESHRIVGDGFRMGTFQLEADGCRLERWLEKNP